MYYVQIPALRFDIPRSLCASIYARQAFLKIIKGKGKDHPITWYKGKEGR